MTKKIIIIGGGISGLTLACYLSQLGLNGGEDFEITLLEKEKQLGGVIDGVKSLSLDKLCALDLCQRLGLEKEIVKADPVFKNIFIIKKSNLIRVPLKTKDFFSILRTSLISPISKIHMLCELFVPSSKKEEDESVESFFKRRFGKCFYKNVIKPVVSGIYMSDPGRLSLKSNFPKLYEIERKSGSVIRYFINRKKRDRDLNGNPFFSLKGGLRTLIKAIEEKSEKVIFKKSTRIIKVEKNDVWKIYSEKGESFEADILCFATVSVRASEIIKEFAPDISRKLSEINYKSIVTVSMTFSVEGTSHFPGKFGFIVPCSDEKFVNDFIFSCIRFSIINNGRDMLVDIFIDKTIKEGIYPSDDEIKQKAIKTINKLFKIKKEPREIFVTSYLEALPEYIKGHSKRVENINKSIEKYTDLFFVGNAYEGFDVADCMSLSEKTAEKIFLTKGKTDEVFYID